MIDRYFAVTQLKGCPPAFKAAWDATCVEADMDGDAAADTVLFVPLAGGAGRSPNPAVVFVRPTAGVAAIFPAGGVDADGSPLGRAAFTVGDRTGDKAAEVSYLATECGASNCVGRVEVQSWDGTAWRDLGPGDSYNNPVSVEFALAGARSRLTVRAGTLGSVGAGPTRNTTSVYGVNGGRFARVSATPDKPVYLYHAIEDADALFRAGDFASALKAYRTAIDDATLMDWQKDRGLPPGRPRLTGYALFRIAVATAATGADARPAIDDAITNNKEPLFVEAVQAFRRGLQERDGVHGGCVEATRYLSDAVAKEILAQVFEYGFANPKPSYLDVCPL